MVDEDGVIRHTTEHNHPPEADKIIVDRFRKVLTQRATTENTDLHMIYLEEATNRHADASLLYTFSQAESCMRKARRKQHPQEPATIQELRDVLENSELFKIHCGNNRDVFYQNTICSEEATCIMLWHNRTLETLGKIDELYVDCSLELAGSNTTLKYHLLVGLTIHKQRCIPVFFSILYSKTYAAFVAIFSYTREQLGAIITPTIILSEPNECIHRALEIIMPETTIKVYWHHYTDAVLKQMRELGLSRETTRGHACSGLRMLLVLPLLPANYITPGLDALKKWMKEKNIYSQSFCQLCDYVEQSWLSAVGAKKLSMFGNPQSVSNLAKQFLKDLTNQDGLQNGTIWKVVESLAQIATKQFVKLLQTQRQCVDNSPAKPLKKMHLVQETVINNAIQLWIKTSVHLRNPLQFLQLCSHCINDAMIMESLQVPANYGATAKSRVPSNVSSTKIASVDNNICSSPITTSSSKKRQLEISAPMNGPPPLAFFPKMASKPIDTNHARALSCSQLEPPPLVPISAHSHSLLPVNDDGQQDPSDNSRAQNKVLS
ncbi:uncharacterized protein LOC129776151 isoform X2 [Toxorhynchites rutilus septentrionalis]|nr:uncharacterized protein LOC129776151 isoform X2 [Toxorhynchites rutilus septentrionalis]XP_055637576.1 uncharacterized protein LOC129776151 isoform X2 [Toxorhynchites rutilus septentrionalis]XP_055637577.1 uncharacterized protein LOC129776151 isoform X2 [Toxorhynchites rutilus septentrionalis]